MKTRIMMTTLPITADCEIELPVLPNFIRLTDGRTIDVKDMHPASLGMLADKWKEALLVHADERRRQNILAK